MPKLTKNPKYAGPGDGGPCPRCGKDMREKTYDEKETGISSLIGFLDAGATENTGRYWHMLYEHGIMENYVSPGSRPDYYITEGDDGS